MSGLGDHSLVSRVEVYREIYEAERVVADGLADELSVYLDDEGAILPEVAASELGPEVVLSIGELQGIRSVMQRLATRAGLEQLDTTPTSQS